MSFSFGWTGFATNQRSLAGTRPRRPFPYSRNYGEPGADLVNEDLETLVSDLESMIDEADEVLSKLEDEAAERDDE